MINRVIASPVIRTLLLGLTVLSLAGIGGSLYAVLASQTRTSWKSTLQVATERYVSSLKDVETAYRGYIIAGTSDFLAPYEEAKTRLNQQAAVLQEAATQAGLDDDLSKRMITEGQTLLRLADAVVIARSHSFSEAQTLMLTRAGKDLMDRVRVDLRIVESWSQQQSDTIRQQTRWVYLPIAIVSLLLLALAISIFFHFATRAWRATLHARSLLADVMGRAPVGLALLDQNLCISQSNKAFANMTTEKGTELQVGSTLSAVAPQIEQHLRQRLRRAITDRFNFKDQEAGNTLELVLNSSSSLHPQSSAHPKSSYMKADVFPIMLVREDGAQNPGVGLVLTDVTSQQEAALELEAARNAAEGANRAKSTFIANMSHELRTPLTAVLGYCELIEEDLRDLGEEAILGDLNKINANARHLLGLINDVLDLSKVEAQKMDVHAIEFTVGSLFDEVEATTGSLMSKNNNTLTITAEDRDTVLETDDLKVKQILLNLMSNAAKFTSNGQIAVHAAAVAPQADTELAVPHTRFTVRDTGIGMSPEQLANLFQRFSQADETTTRKYGGTGLGLALTRALTVILGGEVTVESTEGQGTTFTVTIPTRYVKPPETVAAADSPSATQPDSPTGETAATVLVVDDDPAARELLTRHLQREGFAVLTATSGAEALERLKTNQPLAVLLDVMMPGMDGWHVLRTIRNNPDTHALPVIMQTVLNERNFAYALGATDYLKKPVRRDTLAEALRALVPPSANHTVLVVDDDRDASLELMEMLRHDGWTCHLALNETEALQVLAENPPDLALVNLTMPDMSGYAFIREMRNNPAFVDLPLVVMTAEDPSSSQVRDLAGDSASIVQKGAMPLADLVGDLRRIAEHTQKPSDPPLKGTAGN